MKNAIFKIIRKEGKKENVADINRVINILENKKVSKEESIQLLKEMRGDGIIYFVLSDEYSYKMNDPALRDKITF